MKSDAGQRSFAVLLFQDLAVIPMLAVLPLLAMPGVSPASGDASHAGLMASTPVLLVAYEKLVVPRFGTKAVLARDDDAIHEEFSVIIAGVGQFGSTIGHSAGIAKARVLVMPLATIKKRWPWRRWCANAIPGCAFSRVR